MKIAIPVKNDNKIDDHFGHCEFYNVYSLSDKNVVEEIQTIKSEQGCGCKSNIAQTLAGLGVTTMLAGGIGDGAINVLNNAGIKVIRGCRGNASEAVKLFIDGKITDSGSSCLQHHHHHGEGHELNH